ncbi:MAG: hypothetical protein E7327_07705 [Clostridiales bacterium]|nr:hypothetical protein [Clostridiales bacterium]
MCKHAFLRLAVLALAITLMLITPALAASCTLCGGETGSDDYLCTDCLLKLLNTKKEPVPVQIAGAVQNEDGTVTLVWTDDAGNAPYKVYYQPLENAPVPFGWTAAEGLRGTSYTFDRLVPGMSYMFTVVDAQGQTATHIWYAPVPGEDTQIGAKIRFKAMRRTDRLTREQEAFSASDIAEDNGALHGLYLRLTYSTLKKTRHYAFQIAVQAPNGFRDVIFSGNLELHHGRSSIPVWGFIPMDDYFTLLEKYYGGVPTGEYDVTLYFNGNRVYTAPFTVID